MKNMITSISKILVLTRVLLTWTYADQDMCHTERSLSELALVGHVYKTLPGKQLPTCVAACEMEVNCYSINYQRGTKTCELSRQSAHWYPGDVQPRAESVYLSMVIREYDPCIARQPPCADKCISRPGSLETECVCHGGQNKSCDKNSCVPHALGMENGTIGNDQLEASSTHGTSQLSFARLKYSGGSWTPLTDHTPQWFQVNFAPKVKVFTGIATQGNGNMWWYVTYYVIKYKLIDGTLQDYTEKDVTKIFKGNTDKDLVLTNSFESPFKADTIRICPKQYVGRVALRMELYGCDVV